VKLTREAYVAHIGELLGFPEVVLALCEVEPCACFWEGCEGWYWRFRTSMSPAELVHALTDAYGGNPRRHPTLPGGYSAPHDTPTAPERPERP